jgi:hypothetical protein
MKLRNAQFLFSLCSLLVACYPVHAQLSSEGTQELCRSSVQAFYAWYVPKRLVEDKDLHIALEQRGQAFGRELTRSLRGSDIESRILGDPVLDFDPILNTQDPGDRYTVRSVRINHKRCLADVYGVWSRLPPNNGQTPNVVAELAFEKRRWVFVNFHYPGSGNVPSVDLLKILRAHYNPPKETK